ncbi:MAG: DNA-binding transcriptional regulator [Kiritimatiellae bacterium]|nr:DNA-binding transcriptional regulator [Kiritimatiellia bacterium]
MIKIALTVERSRAYGRLFCEGVADYAQTMGDWSLEFLDDPEGDLSRYDGFISRLTDDSMSERLRSLGKPVVDAFYKKDAGFGVADTDNTAIAQLAVRHFITRKFEHFGFCGYDGIRFSDARKKAFIHCLELNRYGCNSYETPERVLEGFDRDVIRNERVDMIPDRAELKDWVKCLPRPCAVFCCHDLRAYQLAKVCRELSLDVPGDIAILGVDDDRLLCTFSTPMLSSIDPDAQGVGREAARILDRMLRDADACAQPPIVLIEPKGVVTRASTETYPVDPPWLSDALVFIRKQVSRKLTAADVFDHLGLSHALVEKAFRTVLGSTVQREIMKCRIEEAEHLLATTRLPVVQIAGLSGFASAQYFCRSFAAAKGVSPLTYREKKCSKN